MTAADATRPVGRPPGRAGDAPLTPDQRALVEAYAARYPDPVKQFIGAWRMVYGRARMSGLDDKDLRSLCWAAVYRAAQKYDPARGAEFATYAAVWMRGFVNHAASKAGEPAMRRAGRLFSGDSPVAARAGGRPLTVLGTLAWPDGRGDAERVTAIALALDEVLAALPPRARLVVELRYGLGGAEPLTYPQIAARLGRTKQRAKQIEQRALRVLRAGLKRRLRDYLRPGPAGERRD